ncbi:MAG TPA: glycine cleavage system aminomethyltransferase GcvT [Streptosporangiaceae bacterium]|jgi:aminomethyltransferase|nr:glycine cleavage system aminomethyltransferase GcvT [Streptosporangiaceae bacterium]
MEPQSSSLRHSPLQSVHEHLGATLTEFAGWQMPLRYGSETAEHNAVRTAAGLFDLSHMGEIVLTGPQAGAALDYALVGQPSTLRPGRARYSMICAEDGGVLDDLIVYRLGDEEFFVVANASNTGVVAGELTARAAAFKTEVRDRTADYALIAVQGPNAASILAPVTDTELDGVKYYASHTATICGHPVLLARTGYTGEDGFEMFCAPAAAEPLWAGLTAAGQDQGLVPAGLAARDTLRLEAGMPLYGNELGRDMTPFDAGLGRVVKLDKPGDFVGRAALAEYAEQPPRRVLAGLACRGRRVPRHGYAVLWDGQPCGIVTSGAPSPTLGQPIAMAYLDPQTVSVASSEAANTDQAGNTGQAGQDGDSRLAIDIRGRGEAADFVTLPFYSRRH